VQHFASLVSSQADCGAGELIIDVGGGLGFFAKRLGHLTGRRVKVLDTDVASVEACRRSGIEAVCCDALDPQPASDECIICLNLILHHLVGPSEQVTLDLQRRALAVWRSQARLVFVHEYIYESYLGNVSGWLIFQITKSRILSQVGRAVSRFVPSLRANTFGVGVRFRAHQEWVRVFSSAGYEVKSSIMGHPDGVSLPLRLLLIKRIRRDSFLLQPKQAE
jgi:hypothetical protein